MLGLALFPAVLRSDNAKEFVSGVVSYMNDQLSITHVTGSTYHPQSQGKVERMHRTLNDIMTGLCRDHPQDWEKLLKYAQCVLRCTPLKALWDRSPYRAVTKLCPRLTGFIAVETPVRLMGVDERRETPRISQDHLGAREACTAREG